MPIAHSLALVSGQWPGGAEYDAKKIGEKESK